MQAKIKNHQVFSIKKGEIVETEKDIDEIKKDIKSYVICLYEGNKFRIDKKNLEFIEPKKKK